MFYLWKHINDDEGEPIASFRTQTEAEAAGVGYVCSQQPGSAHAVVTTGPIFDSATIVSFIRMSAGYYHVGQPGLWHGGNGAHCLPPASRSTD